MKKNIRYKTVRFTGFFLLAKVFFAFSLPVFAESSVDDDFIRELKLVEALKVYNSQLNQQIEGQEQVKKSLLISIEKSTEFEPQVSALMEEMVVALSQFVENDLPFHKSIRSESIARLQQMMADSSLSVSDRFKSIMDIYTVEMEYGNTYEAYSDIQSIKGQDVEVNMLRLGRLELYFQSKDGKYSAMWDKNSDQWVALSAESNRPLKKAIKVAAKQVAPELINLPVSAPEEI